MEFTLLEKDRAIIRKGYMLLLLGIIILLVNAPLDINETFKVIIVFVAMAICLLGTFLVNQNDKGMVVGSIDFNQNEITITKDDQLSKIPVVPNTAITFIDKGYKNQNYIRDLLLGLLVFKNGVCRIKIHSGENKYDFFIRIDNASEMEWLKSYLRSAAAHVRIKRWIL
jgi:hypothetical protein